MVKHNLRNKHSDSGALDRERIPHLVNPEAGARRGHPHTPRVRWNCSSSSPICKGLRSLSSVADPDPDADFLPIPEFGSRGQKGTGSRIRIRNTIIIHHYFGIYVPHMVEHNQHPSRAAEVRLLKSIKAYPKHI